MVVIFNNSKEVGSKHLFIYSVVVRTFKDWFGMYWVVTYIMLLQERETPYILNKSTK